MIFNNLGNIIFHDTLFEARELRADINRIRHFIKDNGLGAGLTAVAVKRNELLICTVIGMLECNAPFLPIDLSLPKDRVSYMLDNAGVKNILISDREQDGSYGEYNYLLINREAVKDKSADFVMDEADCRMPAYVLYTSGMTGKPKGVEVTAKGFFNFIDAVPDVVRLRDCRTAACFTSFSFDIFFLEAVLCLTNGITVVLADDEEQRNPKKMLKLIGAHNIDCLQITPSRMRLLLLCADDEKTHSECGGIFADMKVIMLGGERLTDELLREVKSITNASVYNMYGPTETTIWSSVSDLTAKEKSDIGVPIKNTVIYCLNDRLQKAGTGEVGEIVIGGDGLANGYIAQPELTRQAFITLPFEPYERVYRTGDLGFFDADHVLHYEGRADSQIKLHGFRIEPEEVEEALNNIPGIEVSAVCFDSENDRLTGFYVADSEKNENEIKLALSKVLPAYMVPSRLFLTDELKYTVSGKVDRNAMLRNIARFEAADIECGDTSEARVIKVFRENFADFGALSCDTELSGLGIHSMNYIQVIVELEEIFDIEFAEECLKTDYFNTIGDIAEYVHSRIGEQSKPGSNCEILPAM